jgi:SH3 domain-containing protein
MIRHAAAVAVVMCLFSTPLYAQSTVFTVSAASADVYKGPSTGSPVIGHTQRGASFEVTRELGSWVKIVWPQAADGVGYLHVTMGSLGHPATNPAGSVASVRTEPRSSSPQPTSLRGGGAAAIEQPALKQPVYVTPATHMFGLGGRLGGPALGFGGSARGWQHDKFGIQFEVSHHSLDTADALSRVTSLQFEPSALYSLPNTISDSLWLRPYIGSGLNFNHQTWKPALGVGSVSANSTGFRVFGGSEMTLPAVPQIAISAELGYHWTENKFPGADFGGLGLAVSAHWYMK